MRRVARDLARLAPAESRSGSPNGARSGARDEDSAPSVDQREVIGRSLLAAFPDRVARRVAEAESPRWRMVGGRGLIAGATAVRQAELCLALRTAGVHRGDALLHVASEIRPEWLPKEHLQTQDELIWDSEAARVAARRRTLYLDLVLEEVEIPITDEAQAERLLVEAALEEELLDAVFERGEVARFLARAECLSEWRPDLDLPPFGERERRRTIEMAAAGKRTLAQLVSSPWLDLIRGQWSYQQLETLDRLAPSRLQLPSGRSAEIEYRPGAPPVLAAIIQDLFGWLDAPRLAGGRVKLLLHLLAPSRRPQQITDDLEGFWRGSYEQVRRELKGRYVKHDWPADPTLLARRSTDTSAAER